MADEVMRMAESSLLSTSEPRVRASDDRVRRTCASCPDEERLVRKAEAGAVGSMKAPWIVQDVLRCAGRPLDSTSRRFMEKRFGHDFGQVRVHDDSRAAQSAQAVNSLAYEVGSRIVFASGQYAPHTERGQRLLAHELAHVIQQHSTSQVPLVRRACGESAISAKVKGHVNCEDRFDATYRGGPSARPSTENRKHCSTTCSSTAALPKFTFVWESSHPR